MSLAEMFAAVFIPLLAVTRALDLFVVFLGSNR